jgi:hypothetical protein
MWSSSQQPGHGSSKRSIAATFRLARLLAPGRDQVLRNLDVGSHYAGVRQFFFSLLIASEKTSPVGVQRVREYGSLEKPREMLRAHRPDGLPNLMAVGELRWTHLAEILLIASTDAPREDERGYASRAHVWLSARGLAGRDQPHRG